MSALLLLALAALICVASAGTPVLVSANVRGKRYAITASTVAEVTSAIEKEAGLEASEQSVLFRGRVLSPSDELSEVGVAEGDTLNIVKGRRARVVKPSADEADLGVEEAGLGMDERVKEAMGNVDPEQLQKASKAMDAMLDSDFIDEYFSDDEKLEAARVEMLNNIDKYDQAMPGFKEQAKAIASDPVKWKEAMMAAKSQMVELKKQRDASRSADPQQPQPQETKEDEE